ncbi:MAG: ankyrin repeat domain-containing protein [Pseudomonadota bacterium]
MTPDPDRLRRRARTLLRDARAGDPAAAARLATVARGTPRLADALHVIAREAGHESWPKLLAEAEIAALDRAGRIARLDRALHHGQHWMTARLLAEDPTLAAADLGLRAALLDAEGVHATLAADPRAAVRALRGRRPILHLAFSQEVRRRPEKAADAIRVAEALVAAGADVNDGFPPEPGSDHRLSALYGAAGHTRHLPLARWLLERGASPDDNESLYHAVEDPDPAILRLLLAHGVRTEGTNALARALDFDRLEPVRLLLAHGADPNERVADHPSGEAVPMVPALHQAARRGRRGAFADAILAHGGRPDTAWNGHRPYGLARIYGNRSFAEALAAAGHAHALSPLEAALAACADGSPPPGRPLAALEPSAEARRLLCRLAAAPGRLGHMQALVTAGADPDAADEMALTPLHAAGWRGDAVAVEWLLGLGPDLTHRNAFGGDAMSTVIHGAEFAPREEGADHIACVRLLRAADAPLSATATSGDEEMAAFLTAEGAGPAP